ncbi:MAG: DUF5071 domain-containing protein [Ruminococcaceae bacterium]|nr:DUF5071 domain-containing protein [Oscillospiraceae bacterium]
MISINEIYKMMDWKNSPDIISKGINLAKEIDDLSLLIMPSASVSVWEYCADILYEKEDLLLEPYLPSLLEWLEDLNWPGAMVIAKRLMVFSGKKLKQPFIDRYNYAVNLNNTEGLLILDKLSILFENEELKEELPKEIIEVLQKHYHNPGWWDVESF